MFARHDGRHAPREASSTCDLRPSRAMDSLSGLSPEMRKLVRRSMSPRTGGTSDGVKVKLSPEDRRKRELQRKAAEFWSKGAHGYSKSYLAFCRNVDLTGCSLIDDDGEALASELTREMTNLSVINLSTNKFGDRTLVALAVAFARGAAPLITHLQLGHNAFSDRGVKAFSAALVAFDGFDNLRDELLAGKAAVEESTRPPVRKALPRLERLMVGHNAIGPRGIEYLARALESGALKALTCLELCGNPIGDAGVATLAKVAEDEEVLPRLSELNLRDTNVTDNGLTPLAETMMPTMGGLRTLRTLLVDDRFDQHEKLQAAYNARTGQGGVHACRIPCFDPAPLSSRTPRVQDSPRFLSRILS